MPGELGRSYLPRLADSALSSRLQAMGAVLVEGVKGCGKTATARQVAASEVLLDVDPEAERRVRLDPRLVLDGATPRLIDEWQRAPRLWDAVRRAVDDRGRAGQFILTGSATPRDEIARHSGAGRFGIVRMRTMTLAEKQAVVPAVSVAALMTGQAPDPANCEVRLRDYLHHIAVGGWPLLVGASEDAASAYLEGYVDIIVDRDIDEVSGHPRDPRLARRFLHAYAQMTSQLATISAITRRALDDEGDAADSQFPNRDTIRAYLDALRRMMIVDEVPAWDPSVRSSKRLVNTPKRQLADPSLAASLLRMSPERMLADLETTGFLFESLAAHDLRIYAEANGAACYHYREAEGRLEVDLVLEDRDGDWLGVEVKLGANQIDQAAACLLRLADRVRRPPKALIILTGTSLAYTRDDGVHVIPLGTLGP